MKKRKVSSTTEAAIILLSEGFNAIDDDLLDSIEETLRQERRKRSLPSPCPDEPGDGQLSTPATETSLARSSDSPRRRTVDEISTTHRTLLFKVLFSRTAIKAFFEDGVEKVISEVLARADGRIELLRKTNKAHEYTLSDKFERLLTDRSLALSHEQYRDGKEPVPAFARTLKLKKPDDAALAASATYRGKVWRDLEKKVGEPGISAVMCCEHTLFKKGVRNSELESFTECFTLPCFAPILALAKQLNNALEESQLAFNKSMEDDTRDGSNGSSVAAEHDSVSSADVHPSDTALVPIPQRQGVPVPQHASVNSRQERHDAVSFCRSANTNCAGRSVQLEPNGNNATPDSHCALDQQVMQPFGDGAIPGNFSQFSEAANFPNLGGMYPGEIQPANFADIGQAYEIEPANFANLGQAYTGLMQSANFPQMSQDILTFARDDSLQNHEVRNITLGRT